MLLKPPEDHVDMTEDEPLWVCKSMHMHIGMHIIMSIIIPRSISRSWDAYVFRAFISLA